MYSGGYGFSISSFLGLAESQGFYADTGGYGWYYNADTNKSIDLVFAPGGGQRITYYVGDPSYQTVFDKVVKEKSPLRNKEALQAVVAKAGGKETTGRSVTSSSAAGAKQAARTPAAAADPKETLGGDDKKLWEQSWFLPVVGAVTVAGVLAIALWPSKTATPLRSNRKR
jgi:hypothetical protein